MVAPFVWKISVRCMRYPQRDLNIQTLGLCGTSRHPTSTNNRPTSLERTQNILFPSNHHFSSDSLHISSSFKPPGIHHIDPRLLRIHSDVPGTPYLILRLERPLGCSSNLTWN